MKKYLKILLPLCLVATAPATMAADKSYSFSGNVALTTDYIYRGVTQTNGDPALQGGFDFEHKKGFYAGVWGSNVEFKNQAHLEIDYYGGYKFKIGKFGLDVGAIAYTYPGDNSNRGLAKPARELDFNEIYIGASFETKIGTWSGKYSNASEFFGTTQSADYIEFGWEKSFKHFSVSAHVGKSDGDAFDVVGGKDLDYTDTKIAISKDFAGFSFELAVTDTDYSKAQCAKGCDSTVVFTVSRSM